MLLQGDSPDREIERDPNVVRGDDQEDRLIRSDTTSRMLRQFQQMERQGGERKGETAPPVTLTCGKLAGFGGRLLSCTV